jgi:hypothetical protein
MLTYSNHQTTVFQMYMAIYDIPSVESAGPGFSTNCTCKEGYQPDTSSQVSGMMMMMFIGTETLVTQLVRHVCWPSLTGVALAGRCMHCEDMLETRMRVHLVRKGNSSVAKAQVFESHSLFLHLAAPMSWAFSCDVFDEQPQSK